MSEFIQVFRTAADGLDAEMKLLQETVECDFNQVIVWQAGDKSLTLPERFSRTTEFETTSAVSLSSGWPVFTRRTGGGITPQGPGVLNFAVTFKVPPRDAKSVAASYAAICDPLIEAFSNFSLAASTGAVSGSFCDGDYNLEIEGRKIVGTAQRWRGDSVLCHALVLIDIDLKAAVLAAQRLSDGLGLGDEYKINVHTQLAEHISKGDDHSLAFAEVAIASFVSRGFTVASLS